jgi:hypothetical protein
MLIKILNPGVEVRWGASLSPVRQEAICDWRNLVPCSAGEMVIHCHVRNSL